ncbi:MAG: PEGA domain-containing protein [Candidatus Aminicenantes bacterium]|nr:PEGA domain-containing protein [Candidatus Aminicenantes bacterium]
MTINRIASKKKTAGNVLWSRTATATALLALLTLLTSCATILKGDRRNVHFDSEPPGADVYINGTLVGRTPVMLQLKAGESCMVEFRKEGYRSEVRQLRSRIQAEWLILDIICGTVPLIVDAVTGSWDDFPKHRFKVVIEKMQNDGGPEVDKAPDSGR